MRLRFVQCALAVGFAANHVRAAAVRSDAAAGRTTVAASGAEALMAPDQLSAVESEVFGVAAPASGALAAFPPARRADASI
jgi:hypothetical protein